MKTVVSAPDENVNGSICAECVAIDFEHKDQKGEQREGKNGKSSFSNKYIFHEK